MEAGGLSLRTISSIYVARDRALVTFLVPVHTPSNHAQCTNEISLRRDESGMPRATEDIFASGYAAYEGSVGKKDLFF